MSFRTDLATNTIKKFMLETKKLDELEAEILSQEAYNLSVFNSKIEYNLDLLKINDAKEVLYKSDIITELKSEISTEKIESIVKSFLQSATLKIDVPKINLASSQQNIDTYVNMFSSVIEASKSNSESATNLKFSSNRIIPGVFIFVYASSIRYKIEEGSESQIITSTGLQMRMKISIDDVQNQAEFDAKKIDKESILKIKYIQASLLEDIIHKEIGIKTWMLYDNNYLKVTNQISKRLGINTSPNSIQIGSGPKGSPELQKLVKGFIAQLKTMSDKSIEKVIKVSEDRIIRSYY